MRMRLGRLTDAGTASRALSRPYPLRIPGAVPQLRLTSAPFNSSVNAASDGRSRCSLLRIGSRNSPLRFNDACLSASESSTDRRSRVAATSWAGCVADRCCSPHTLAPPVAVGMPCQYARRNGLRRRGMVRTCTHVRVISCSCHVARPQRDWLRRPIRGAAPRERDRCRSLMNSSSSANAKLRRGSASTTAQRIDDEREATPGIASTTAHRKLRNVD